MFKVINSAKLNENTYKLDILAPRIAKSALPGQFVIVKVDEFSERIPLTIADYDVNSGTVQVVIQAIGESTKKIVRIKKDDYIMDVVGPLGKASEFIYEPIESIKNENILFVAGGLGAAPVYPQVKWLHERGIKCDVIIGARNKDILIYEKEMTSVCENLYMCTDDGSYAFSGNVTVLLKDLVQKRHKKYTKVIAIGPLIMMKFTCLTTKELGIPTIVSMNPIMVDGTGMCGACRITVGGKVKFACVDGPEFDGHLIDFDEALSRQRAAINTGEKIQKNFVHSPECKWPHDLLAFDKTKKVEMPAQDPAIRAKNFDEVTFGYSLEQAKLESSRCLNCKNPKCVEGCPVGIDIPAFINEIKLGNTENAFNIISEASSLPAICGRVCPQENQCEGKCIVGIKNEPVAIGRLEQFVGDYGIKHKLSNTKITPKNGKKVAIVGAGPAGLACAGDLAKMGYTVKIFEVLHEPGGVLVYGIPEFRLPKEKVVKIEIENVKKLGVEIETNVVVGRTINIDTLMNDDGYDAVFISSGAGLPKFMSIKGESATGVFSANEYLTRSNLMKAYSEKYDTPIMNSKRVAVIGGGNVAMDAARTALRLGAEVHVVYRRGEAELPARLEEVHHAKEEGIIFDFLTNPTEILSDENGYVTGIRCVKMKLGEPDASGRQTPIIIDGSEFTMNVDTVLMSLGTSPNPLIAEKTKGMDVNKRNCIIINDQTGETTRAGVFAGGDVVSGAATVILAMGAGKIAAKGIDNYIKNK